LAATSGARVLAIEPNPETFAILVENVSRNRIEGITLRNLAVGATAGPAQLYIPESATTLSSLLPSWYTPGPPERPLRTVSTQLVTLDGLTATPEFESIDWILIDVEGFEREVLAGGVESLARARRIVIEVTNGPNELDCRKILEAGGFEIRDRWAAGAAPNQHWYCARPGVE
jgi:FkbM family methyltransferase